MSNAKSSFKDELLSKLDENSSNDFCELTQHQMSNIYSQLSNNSINFNNIDFKEMIFSFIEEIYDDSFKKISSDVLSQNKELLNEKFVLLLKKSYKENIKSVGMNFIYFCEYFDLDLNDTYGKMSQTIKQYIELTLKKMIGNSSFQKHKAKANGGVVIRSLFDIHKNK